MLATFHVFYKFVIAMIKGKCVQNDAVVPGVRSFVPVHDSTQGMRIRGDYADLNPENGTTTESVCSVVLESEAKR